MSNITEIIQYIKIHPLYIEIENLLSQIRNLYSIHASTDNDLLKWSDDVILIFGSAESSPEYKKCLFKLALGYKNIDIVCEEKHDNIFDSLYKRTNDNKFFIRLPFHLVFTCRPNDLTTFNICEVFHYMNLDREIRGKFGSLYHECKIGAFFFTKERTEYVLIELVKLLKDIIFIAEKTKMQTELLNDLNLFPV